MRKFDRQETELKVPFNRPAYIGGEDRYIKEALLSTHFAGGGLYSKKCEAFFGGEFNCNCLLTPSCTHSLEMAALLLDLKDGDEIIMPSFTFVSSANAFVLRGAKIVFVDVRPDTMNIDELLIEAAITSRTKAVVVVHYAGVACEMDEICRLAAHHNIAVIEDAAQGVFAKFNGKPLGSIGDIGAISFHETKNATSGGEGGLISFPSARFFERAEIIREKGTDRSRFSRGEVDKYTWVDLGSSYLPSELQAAYLWGQIEGRHELVNERLKAWNQYHHELSELELENHFSLPRVPEHCGHNGHIFYVKLHNAEDAQCLQRFLRSKEIVANFHYVPLHTSPAGIRFSRFNGADRITTEHSARLLRLPIFYGISSEQISYVCDCIREFCSDFGN